LISEALSKIDEVPWNFEEEFLFDPELGFVFVPLVTFIFNSEYLWELKDSRCNFRK
jgi:hypothetical protein